MACLRHHSCIIVSVLAAEAIVQALASDAAENRIFAIESTEGQGPGDDAAQWERLFKATL